jgi:hypothetical protein
MSILIVNGTIGETASSRVNAVMRDTWGHMGANPGTRYRGHVVFAAGCYGGERIVLEAEFGNAGFGPWFYEGVNEWVSWLEDIEEGHLYRFEGYYRLGADGTHVFEGDLQELFAATTPGGREA